MGAELFRVPLSVGANSASPLTKGRFSVRKENTKRLAVSALLIAVSALLALFFTFVVPINLPLGGSLTIASMLPIVVASYMYGIPWGLLCGFTYSVLQMLMSVKTVSAMFVPGEDGMLLWQALTICFIDYILAYTVLGIGGATRGMRNKTLALVLGCVIALSARYVCHIVSGYIFYGAWADWFFTEKAPEWLGNFVLARFSGNSLALVYSVVYNGLYMIPEIIITAVAAIPVSKIKLISSAGRSIRQTKGKSNG